MSAAELSAVATLGFAPRSVAKWLVPLAARGADAGLLLERARELRSSDEWWPDSRRLDAELDALEKTNATILLFGHPQYPTLLRRTPDPPLCLHVRGRLPDRGKTCVAIVGSRSSKRNCLSFTSEMARGLASAQVPVVSGMARGVDAAAHSGCLDGGELTLAVLGCGVDVCYPRENKDLMERILETGALVSEHPMGVQPAPYHFPERNRIISGWCAGTVVVEAGAGSGALITSRYALEHNRTVFAVPGAVWNPLSFGPNELIRDGAVPVRNAGDILEEVFGIVPREAKSEALASPRLTDVEGALLRLLDHDVAQHADDLARLAGLSSSEALPALLGLEIKGLATQIRGLRFLRIGGGA